MQSYFHAFLLDLQEIPVPYAACIVFQTAASSFEEAQQNMEEEEDEEGEEEGDDDFWDE